MYEVFAAVLKPGSPRACSRTCPRLVSGRRGKHHPSEWKESGTERETLIS